MTTYRYYWNSDPDSDTFVDCGTYTVDESAASRSLKAAADQNLLRTPLASGRYYVQRVEGLASLVPVTVDVQVSTTLGFR